MNTIASLRKIATPIGTSKGVPANSVLAIVHTSGVRTIMNGGPLFQMTENGGDQRRHTKQEIQKKMFHHLGS